MSAFTDFLNKLTEPAQQRLKNPITGTLIIAILAINWQAILLLIFSEKSIEEKLAYLNEHYLNNYTLYLIPFGITIVYLLLLPYAMAGLDKLLSFSFKLRSDSKLQNNQSQHRLLEAEARHNFNLEEIKSGNKILGESNTKILRLENEVMKKNKEIESYKEELK